VRRAQFLTGVDPTLLAAQPLAVDETRAGVP
jgi:hypothetical protein